MNSERGASALRARREPLGRAGRRRILLGGVGGGWLLVLSGCGGWAGDTRIRAVNATVDIARIDLRFNDWLFASSVGNGGMVSAYGSRDLWSVGPVGRLEVWSAGGTARLLATTATLPAAEAATVVVMGSTASGLRLRVLNEDADRPDGQGMKLRVLHAWPGGGALDAFVTPTGQSLAGRLPDWVLSGDDDLSAFASVGSGNRLRITPRGRPDLVLFDATSAALSSGLVATLVVAPTPGSARAVVAVLPQGAPGYVLASAAAASD